MRKAILITVEGDPDMVLNSVRGIADTAYAEVDLGVANVTVTEHSLDHKLLLAESTPSVEGFQIVLYYLADEASWVTWQRNVESNQSLYWGHYWQDLQPAWKNFVTRCTEKGCGAPTLWEAFEALARRVGHGSN